MHYNLVKASNRRYLEELKNLTKEMPVVYQSVNIMQHTEWVINKPIYEVIKQCMDNDFPLGKLPVNPQTLELPIKPVDISTNKESLIKWKREASKVYEGRAKQNSKFIQVRQIMEEAKMLHDVHLAQGYEGSMLRTNGFYEQKRSYNLQKFKDFHDTEATIVGYEAGKGKFTGLIGKFFMQDDDGNKFGCPIGKGYNFKDRKFILDNIHNYIGERATFTYFQRTNAGSYRHPLFKTLRNYE